MSDPFLERLIRPLFKLGPVYVGTKPAGGTYAQDVVSTYDDLVTFVTAHADQDVYVSTAAFEPGKPRKSRYVISKAAISIDIDDKNMPSGSVEEQHAQALRVVELAPRHRFTVDSGGGYHVHLPVDDILERLERDGVKCTPDVLRGYSRRFRRHMQRAASRAFGTKIRFDNCDGAERVWRTPGTMNCKLEGNPRPVVLVEQPDGPADDDLSWLDEATGEVSLSGTKLVFRSQAVSKRALDDVRDHFGVRWPMASGDQSAHDYEVVRHGMTLDFEVDELEDLVRLRRASLESAEDREKGSRADYVSRTVAAAQKRELPAPTEPVETCSSLRFYGCNELECSVPPTTYVLERVMPENQVGLLIGGPKSGKTTLAFGVVAAAERGHSFAGLSTGVVRAVILSEEGLPTLREKVEKFGIRHARVLSQRTAPRVSIDEAMDAATAEARREDANLIVVDTLSAWGGLTGDAENSAGSIQQILEVLKMVAEQGFTVLAIHHTRKKRVGGAVESVRGSSAIAANVDTVINFRAGKGTLRHLEVVGRSGDLVSQISLRLNGAVYERIETSAEQPLERVEKRILEALAQEPLTREQLKKRVTGKVQSVNKALAGLVEAGRVRRTGGGMKNDPHIFSLSLSPPVEMAFPLPTHRGGKVGMASVQGRPGRHEMV